MTAQLIFDTTEAQRARVKAIQAEVGPMLSLAKQQFDAGGKALVDGYPGSAHAFLSLAKDTLDTALKQFPKE